MTLSVQGLSPDQWPTGLVRRLNGTLPILILYVYNIDNKNYNQFNQVMFVFQVEIQGITELWAGSIEVGVTSHNPDDIVLPPTMTSMPTGTWMLSGTSIIVNGKEALREYSSINLETLKVLKTSFDSFYDYMQSLVNLFSCFTILLILHLMVFHESKCNELIDQETLHILKICFDSFFDQSLVNLFCCFTIFLILHPMVSLVSKFNELINEYWNCG